jgi:hypothetical protein
MNDSTSKAQKAGQQKQMPQSAEVVKKIFQELGIKEYEPQLLLQISDLAHLLTKQILTEARSLSEFAGKKQIDKSDIEFTLQSFQEKFKPNRPSKVFLTELAEKKNAEPLPPLRQNFGLRLPNDRFCQLQPNFVYTGSTENGSNSQFHYPSETSSQTSTHFARPSSRNAPSRNNNNEINAMDTGGEWYGQMPESSTTAPTTSSVNSLNPETVSNLLINNHNRGSGGGDTDENIDYD